MGNAIGASRLTFEAGAKGSKGDKLASFRLPHRREVRSAWALSRPRWEHRVKWNCKAGACCLGVIVSASAVAQAPDATQPSETVGRSLSAEAAPRQKAHLSAQAIQAILLKGQILAMQKAAGSAAETTCLVSLWYASDGTIHAVQLVKASGFPLVDQACLQAAIGQRVESIPVDRENGGRTYFPIHWFFDHEHVSPSQPRIDSDPSIPRLPSGGAMNPLPRYPAEALAQRAHGICKMHIAVTEKGDVSSIEITQSTGSAALDEACKEAINGSPIMPATNEGRPVSGTTDVAINWRLPRI
jgi:TonB family protein